MGVLAFLKRQRRLWARCPECDSDFRLSQAELFDATKPLSGRGLQYLRDLQAELTDGKRGLADLKRQTKTQSTVAAVAVNIGKVVEKIAPSLPGFPLDAADCRSLLEPIDYVAFKGLAERGRVDAVCFVDVKSGRARLTAIQRMIASLVRRGKVSVAVADDTAPEPT